MCGQPGSEFANGYVNSDAAVGQPITDVIADMVAIKCNLDAILDRHYFCPHGNKYGCANGDEFPGPHRD